MGLNSSLMRPLLPARAQPAIRFAPGLREILMNSVGRLPPESYAILAGCLDEPFRVTDVRPMPPAIDAQGRHRASSGTVTLNVPFIEYYLNTELLPFGKYILGALHSHPGDYRQLSSGAPGSDQGDIPSMRAHLEGAAKLERPWHNYLAPILTNPGAHPTVTGWILRLDRAEPISAEIVWEEDLAADEGNDGRITPESVLALLAPWQAAIKAAASNSAMTRADRRHTAGILRRVRDAEIKAFERRLGDIDQYSTDGREA